MYVRYVLASILAYMLAYMVAYKLAHMFGYAGIYACITASICAGMFKVWYGQRCIPHAAPGLPESQYHGDLKQETRENALAELGRLLTRRLEGPCLRWNVMGSSCATVVLNKKDVS